MQFIEVLGLIADDSTDHTVKDAQNLSAIVKLRVRWRPNEAPENIEYGINPVRPEEIVALKRKRAQAVLNHQKHLEDWEANEAKRLQFIQAHEDAVVVWKQKFDIGVASLDEKPRMVDWPSQMKPVCKEPVLYSNENRVRIAVQDWLDRGGVVPKFVQPKAGDLRAKMEPVTKRQLRLGLLNIGITETDVDAMISRVSDKLERQIADIEWRTAERYERMHPFIVKLGADLAYTPEQIDCLWDYFQTI